MKDRWNIVSCWAVWCEHGWYVWQTCIHKYCARSPSFSALHCERDQHGSNLKQKKYFCCRFTKLRLAYLTHSLTVILLTMIKWGRDHMRALTLCEWNHFCCKVCHMWTCCCIGLKFLDGFHAKLSDCDQIPHRIMGDKTIEPPYMASNRKIFTYLWLVHVNLYVYLGCPFGTKFYNFMLPLQLKIHTHSNARLNTACDTNTHV